MDNKFRECPNDGCILDFYKGVYEAVYVVLHPFYYSTIIDFNEINDKSWPSDTELLKHCNTILWKDILEIAKFNNLSEIDIGLRTSIGGLRKDMEAPLLAEKIRKLFFDQKIISPESTGLISPFVFKDIFSSIHRLAINQMWLIDEFCLEIPKVRDIETIVNNLSIERGSYYSDNNTLLVTTHWDSHCSFVCGSKSLLDQFIALSQLEGFFCSNKTQVYWGIYDL